VTASIGASDRRGLARLRTAVDATGDSLGHRLRMLVAKPGLDGHSNGAEQVAVAARDAGFEVIYQGIRQTTAQIVAAAIQEDIDCVGVSVLSGSHLQLLPPILEGLRSGGLSDIPVIVGGIIPMRDAETLKDRGVAAVFTPKDFDLAVVMSEVLNVIRRSKGMEPIAF
jgi:(2R)-ethylmalonyl-CoA mutase